MILKGSKRGGAVDLGRHLLKPENEHVEVHEIRGFVSDNVVGALQEVQAISRGTKCRKFLFSLALSPPEKEAVPVAVFEAAIETIEAKLGLVGQPRIVLFHEKEGRRHAHCVWSRIRADTMTAIDQPHFKLKLQDVSRQLYLEHGWKMPDGLIDPAFSDPLAFDRHEWFQAQRAGKDPRSIKAVFRQCWASSDSGTAFREALRSRGYYVARGDRRAVVAVDLQGETYAVARWTGLKTKDVIARVGDVDALPSLADTRDRVATLVQEKLSGFVRSARDEFVKAAQELEARRIAMVQNHRTARAELQSVQQTRHIAEAEARAARFRVGLRGLWDRVTGAHAKIVRQNEADATVGIARAADERDALVKTQLAERRLLQQEIRYARRLREKEMARLQEEVDRREERTAEPPDRSAAHQRKQRRHPSQRRTSMEP